MTHGTHVGPALQSGAAEPESAESGRIGGNHRIIRWQSSRDPFSKVFRLVPFVGTLVPFVELGALFQMSIGTPTSFSKGTSLHITH